jgi:hypothetical protein
VEKKMIKKIMNNEDAGTVMLSEVLEAVTVDSVMDMLLMADDGFPTVSILVEDEEGNRVDYLMRATKGYEIHGINQVMNSLNLGITVEFINYDQYELMIDSCMKMIERKRKATA